MTIRKGEFCETTTKDNRRTKGRLLASAPQRLDPGLHGAPGFRGTAAVAGAAQGTVGEAGVPAVVAAVGGVVTRSVPPAACRPT